MYAHHLYQACFSRGCHLRNGNVIQSSAKYCSFADLDEDAEHVPRRATSNQSSGDNERQSFYSPEAADKTADEAGSVSPNIEEQEDSASEKQVVPPKRQRIDSDSDSDSE